MDYYPRLHDIDLFQSFKDDLSLHQVIDLDRHKAARSLLGSQPSHRISFQVDSGGISPQDLLDSFQMSKASFQESQDV